MKLGRIQVLGGVQYGTDTEVQTSALVGGDAPYANPLSPSSTTVGEAIDSLMQSINRYVEVIESPYLVIRAGDYMCLPGSGVMYLGNGMIPGERVSITGVGMWSLQCDLPMVVGDKVGTYITTLDMGCSITLVMTSIGWVTTHLLGNIDILPE